MQKIKEFAYRFRFEIFAALGAAVVLWQMLLPGYVLTLDMVFGPQAPAISFTGLSAAGWPLYALLVGLYYFFSGWVVQKIVLFALFFLLFYLPLKFYPFVSTHGERYVAVLFFAINPFVYERLLAGQLNVLFAYALLFPFVAGLMKLSEAPSRHRGILVFLWLLLVGVFSLHFLVMGIILLALFALVMLRSWELFKPLAIGAIIFAFLSLYWLIPAALTTGTSHLQFFTAPQWQAFHTAPDARLGTVGNVAALYGFWGEKEPWIERFTLPKNEGVWWFATLTAFALAVLYGVYAGLRKPEYRRASIFLLLGSGGALIFASGVDSHVFGSFNNWLFEHIGFWKGFRDSQKWSGVLAACYALFIGLGAGAILRINTLQPLRRVVLLALFALPLLYTPTLLFGANGQLQPVWYPSAWKEADSILARDPSCKALFLPWHEYYSPRFNNDFMLVANTARAYFTCAIIAGKNFELEDIGTPSGLSSEYYAIERAVTSNADDPDATIQVLKKHGIGYIIFTDDVSGIDPYTYPFLSSHKLEKKLSTPGLVLYRVL